MKTVLITGAGGGLGRSFALSFAQENYAVAIADINLEGAQQSADLVREKGIKAEAYAMDVSDEASVQQVVQKVAQDFGRVDVLVNNAAIYGTIERKPFWEIEEKAWDQVMQVNLKGAWLCSKAVFPLMKAQQSGKIIHLSSATVMSGSPQWSHYVASKGGVIGLCRSMAREAGDYGIQVNAVAPGFTLSEASKNLMENASEYGVQRGAIKRASQPEDIVGAVLFFASDRANFITGQTLIVDGGRQFI